MVLRNRRLRATVKGRQLYAYYSVGRLPRSGLPDYRQLDSHSCGFLACLTVVHRFYPDVPDADVLRVIQPRLYHGCDHVKMLRSLAHFGIDAEYKDRLGITALRRVMDGGAVPIITVWPWGWYGDHWTVVRSVREDGHIVLTNHGPIRGMAWKTFSQDHWEPRGGAIICRPEE